MNKKVNERLANNYKCIKMIDDFVKEKGDIYSFVASKIFDCSVNECKEFDENFNKNAEGKRKRDVAKYLCLNRDFVKNIAKDFDVPDLEERIVKAFPWTEFDNIYDEEISFENRVIDSYSFITLIFGYYRMNFMKECLELHTLRSLEDK